MNVTDRLFKDILKIYAFARAITLDDHNVSELGNATIMAEEIMRVADEAFVSLSELDEKRETKSA